MRLRSVLLVLQLVLLAFSCNKVSKQNQNAVSDHNSPLFQLIAANESGITFKNSIKENQKNFFGIFNYVYNGGGVAIADVNGDGWSDIYFTANESSDKLYLNKGNFKFEDVTEVAGLGNTKGWNNGVVMADVNADGFMDIYVCRGGWQDLKENRANLLYINQGDATFKEAGVEFGLADTGYSVMASFFDIDNDNDLDLYLTNRPEEFFLNYEQVLQGKVKQEDSYRDKLYKNENGKFKEVGVQNGIQNNYGYGLGLVTGDVNKDGFVDVFVGNDYLERDYLYLNKGNGSFSEELESHFNHIPFYTMGVDLADLNNDGLEDLIQLEMMPEDYERSKTTMADMSTQLFSDMTANGFHYQYMHNMLQLNRGNGVFSDISQYSGIAKTDWSWACLANDYDNDGLRDIFITNGFKRDIWDKDATIRFNKYMQSKVAQQRTEKENIAHIIILYKENKIENYVYKNQGKLRFTDKSQEWGLHHKSFSNGAATADLDNDGDLDLIINNVDDHAFVYKNTLNETNANHVKIKLQGPQGNNDGLGAKITLMHENTLQFHEFKTVRGYLSSVEPLVHFGLGSISIIDSIEIQWPDGKQNILKSVAPNQTVIVDYNKAVTTKSKRTKPHNLFKNSTAFHFKAAPLHQENDYDDFNTQVLLPHKLSQLGPCIAVADVNNDGLDDFFLGGAANSVSEIYIQNSDATFRAKSNPVLGLDKSYEDVAAVFLDIDNDNDLDLYIVSGGDEFSASSYLLFDRIYINDGSGYFLKRELVEASDQSGGCVVPFDMDADGDLDFFVGGRLVPNAYPFTPKSKILRNDKGKFMDVTATVAPELENIGMVADALLSDIDGDNKEELILVGEWMPITVFKNINGKWTNQTQKLGLENTNGWYNTVAAADLNLDGKEELLVGNLGLNYKFKASKEHPFKIYANDFDQNGTNDIFLAKEYKGREVPVRGLQCSSEQLPGLDRKFVSFSQFAKSNLRQIIGENLDNALHFKAYEFASLIVSFEKEKATFRPLPYEAQFSSIHGFVVKDFNNDGFVDVALAGNKFEAEIETTRADASVGLILLGDGSGKLKALSPAKSGFVAPKNVKSLKQIHLADGSLGILVGNNDDALQLFQNLKP